MAISLGVNIDISPILVYRTYWNPQNLILKVPSLTDGATEINANATVEWIASGNEGRLVSYDIRDAKIDQEIGRSAINNQRTRLMACARGRILALDNLWGWYTSFLAKRSSIYMFGSFVHRYLLKTYKLVSIQVSETKRNQIWTHGLIE